MSSAPDSRSRYHPQGAPGLWLLLLLIPCMPVAGTNPGIKARLTRRALEFGQQVGLELLQSLLQKEHELNLNSSYHSPLLGTLTYTVPRMRIHELQANDSSVDFVEDVGVRLVVPRARVRLSAEWGARLGAVQDKGVVELHMHDLAVATVLGVSADGEGRPTVWSAGCDAHGTHLRLEFRRGQSWLYNLLAPLLQRVLRKELNKQLCIALRNRVHRLEAALKDMKVPTPLNSIAAIDFSLLARPAIAAEHMDIAMKGEFFEVGNQQHSPFSALPVALPTALPTAHEPMVLLAITEFVANSAAFTYFSAGALRRNISGSTLPQRFPLQLKTQSMEIFAPQLQEQYPDQPMELLLWARQQPLLSCLPDALHGTLFGSAEAFVVLPNATRVPVFLLNIDANVTGKPTLSGNRLGASVHLAELSVTQVMTQVGPVEVQKLETLLKLGLRLFGVPWANSECCPRPAPHPLGCAPSLTRYSPHRAAAGWHPPARPARHQRPRPPALAAPGLRAPHHGPGLRALRATDHPPEPPGHRLKPGERLSLRRVWCLGRPCAGGPIPWAGDPQTRAGAGSLQLPGSFTHRPREGAGVHRLLLHPSSPEDGLESIASSCIPLAQGMGWSPSPTASLGPRGWG
ncbi:bactericidal permeability-increasing protein-like isoform X2 [Phaenicophaeus curvirostris]|uniref:bactericidal permeability-increasing protein-like isoform X2 n=1 Tax=Phaenicophaeus curvirostris TaxID=33595 RepID=UPI0037F0E2B9